MSTKRKPKKRKTISLEKKIEILDKLKSGRGSTSVAKEYGMNEATVRTIKRMEDSIRKSVARGTAVSAKFSTYHRDDLIETVEKALLIWIEDNGKKKLPVNFNLIRHKALNIFRLLKEKQQTPRTTEFSASKGWFEKFKKRYSLHNIQPKGEIASGCEKSAKEYPVKLAKIIEEKFYVPDQVFNAEETGLFWKKIPRKTYLSKSDRSAGGFKGAKDRVTLLLCSNASGDRFLKPLVVNKSRRPRAMKGKDLEKLPVHWRFGKKAWMTCSIFEDWFHNCFVPEVRSYLQEKNLEFKVLLLLDNSPNHPIDLEHPNVQIEFLPPDTASLIQPQDQGIMSTFKAYYTKRTIADILRISNEYPSLTLPEVWKNFTIFNCVVNVASAATEVKKSTLNSSWKVIWPEVVVEKKVTSPEDVYAGIVDAAHFVGGEEFSDLNIPDIEELFKDEEIPDEDLVELALQVPEDSTSDSDCENFTEKVISEGLRLGRELQTYFLNRDPDTERALRFQRTIRNALRQYEEIYKKTCRSKQALICDFVPSKSFSLVGSVSNASSSEGLPMKNADEFFVSAPDSDVTPGLPKKRKIVALESSEEE